jgi:hypothetical protein
MNRNILYLVIGALPAAVTVVGYQLYREQQTGITVSIGKDGASVEGK